MPASCQSIEFLNIPLFGGQGITASSAQRTRCQALLDASQSKSCSLLLISCHKAFHSELSSLPNEDRKLLDVQVEDCLLPESLITVLADNKSNNAFLSLTSLFLAQALRYLAYIESLETSTNLLARFDDPLRGNSKSGLGIVGFSSGILTACVVGSSSSTLSYISHAVEAYRLSIWIGIRTQIYRVKILDSGFSTVNHLPWSICLLGMTKEDVKKSISSYMFNSAICRDDFPLCVTATLSESSVTVSGHPITLREYASTLTEDVVCHQTTTSTLYHSCRFLNDTRQLVKADLSDRDIRFPSFSDLIVPVRSTFTGNLLSKNSQTTEPGSLVDLVIDMLLLEEVNWHLVLDHLGNSIPDESPVRILNFGPGDGLARSMKRIIRRSNIDVVDVSVFNSGHSPSCQEPIAIVGAAVNLPGAPNLSELWKVLSNGVNTVTQIPSERFDFSLYTEESKSVPGRKMKTSFGNFIQDVDQFDCKFFKISPREAKSMDPQQRILLHTTFEAIEHAGYVPNSTPATQEKTIGCFIGVATHDYLQNLKNDIDVYYSTGTLKSFLSGRLSYAFGFGGPSVVVDTACSSSLVAIYQACRALTNRDCSTAVAGGVNVISSPDMFLGLDRGHFLSPTGQCKPFDESADGYSRGEGCGVFVLKRLSDAIAENDRIFGVIRGVEVNQSGKAQSITHPDASAQAALFKRLLEKAGLEPDRINVVEAHGTGTQAGDVNEMESIRSVFASRRSNDNPLYVSSIKANIGHLEAASGAAGLAKLLLMLKHETIPPQISPRTLNPKIAPLETDNTIINKHAVRWVPSRESGTLTRMAVLNNFGAAGSNATLLLEEYVPASLVSSTTADNQTTFVFGISAKTESALEKLRRSYLDWLEGPEWTTTSLCDITYTATARRQMYAHRIALSCSTKAELVSKLRITPVATTPKVKPPVVFVFSGQGGQNLGMGKSLYDTSSVFARHVNHCDRLLVKNGFPSVLAIIDKVEGEASGLGLDEEFEAYQTAIFSLEYGLAMLWESWGLKPDSVIGHSLGEYAALVIAGVLSFEDGLLLVANRARLMVRKCSQNSTGMLAVKLDFRSISDVIGSRQSFSALSIACLNGPEDVVVAGQLDQLRSFKVYLDDRYGCKNAFVNVPFGYHSGAMDPILDDLVALGQRVSFRPPKVSFASTVYRGVVRPGDSSMFSSDYFSKHCASRVLFAQALKALALELHSSFTQPIFVEIGPHPTTLPMIKANQLRSREPLLLASLRKYQSTWMVLTNSLSQLYSTSIDIRWREVFSHLPYARLVDAPSYPFDKSKFWTKYEEESRKVCSCENELLTTLSESVSDCPSAGERIQLPASSNGMTSIFEKSIGALRSSILGHRVAGVPLCPASVYFELVSNLTHETLDRLGGDLNNRSLLLHDIRFSKPLVYDESALRTIKSTISFRQDLAGGNFGIGSWIDDRSKELTHAQGEFVLSPSDAGQLPQNLSFTQGLPLLSWPDEEEEDSERFTSHTIYDNLFPRVVEYSEDFRAIQSLRINSEGGSAVVRLPATQRAAVPTQTVLMDTLLHIAGFIANLKSGIDRAYICVRVGSAKLVPNSVDPRTSFDVYCRSKSLTSDGVVAFDVYAVDANDSRRVVVGFLLDVTFRLVRLRGLERAFGVSAPSSPALNMKKAQQNEQLFDSDFDKNDSVGKKVIDCISGACDIAASVIHSHTELDALGVNSLMLIEIGAELGSRFGEKSLDVGSFSACRSVGDVVAFVSASPNKPVHAARVRSSTLSSPRTLVIREEEEEEVGQLNDTNDPIDLSTVIASVLEMDVNEINEHSNLCDMGMDSLTSIETVDTLRRVFGLDIPGDVFAVYPTIGNLRAYLSDRLRWRDNLDLDLKKHSPSRARPIVSSSATATPDLVQLGGNSERIPLFLIHDGSGLVNYYERLAPLGRDVWGMRNPKFLTKGVWDGLGEMAGSYADGVMGQSTGGPVLVGGWSFGGIAAFETARILHRRGMRVNGVLLIDAPNPRSHVPLSDGLIDHVVDATIRGASSNLRSLVRHQFKTNACLLRGYVPLAGGGYPPVVLLRSKEGFRADGVDDVPEWLRERSGGRAKEEDVRVWEEATGGSVVCFDIPGHHFEPFSAGNIEQVSRTMREGCEFLERV